MADVKRTEQGWIAYYILADRCLFRRNTLLECGDVRVVIGTVGLLRDRADTKFETVGHDRHFETKAFHAYRKDGRWWEADTCHEIRDIDAPQTIVELDADDRANLMHEAVVDEMILKLADGWQGEPKPPEDDL